MRIAFAEGAARQVNFDTAPLLRFAAAPRIEVELMPSSAAPGGVGEISVPGIAPALAGALQSAGGERPRRLPLVESGWTFA